MAWQPTFSGGEMVKIENYLKEEIISGKDNLLFIITIFKYQGLSKKSRRYYL